MKGEPKMPKCRSVDLRLTDRERAILSLVVAGTKRSRDIAAKLGCSRATVRYHLQNVYQKLDEHSVAGAAAEALARGLLEVSP